MELRGIYIAHRGLHNEFNENTISAFKKAIDRNIAIEFDVHLTKDNKLVVCHDRNLKRLTGFDINIDEVTYEEIRNIKLIGTNETIPLIEDVLNLINGKVLIDIEIKKDNKRFKMENELIKLMDKYNGDFIIKSFDISSILYIKAKRKRYCVGLLISSKKSDKFYKKALDNLNLSLFSFDFYSPSLEMLPNKKIMKKKKPILIWTIDSREKLDKAKKLGDSFIFEKIDI